MSQPFNKAMVLSAGLGTRLKPITDKVPKPLVPILNLPNILHTLYLVKRVGIRDVILNLHHLPKPIENFLGRGEKWGMNLEYSREEILLGTGGGLKKASSFFGKDRFLLLNCDFISNVALGDAIDFHLSKKSLGTMVLYENPALQKKYSKVGVDPSGNLCSLPRFERVTPTRTGIFTGIHLLENACLDWLKEVPSGINEILYPSLMKEKPDKVFGYFMTRGFWEDTGDVQAIWQSTMHLFSELESETKTGHLHRFLSEMSTYEERTEGVWVPRGESLPDAKLVAPVILGRGLKVDKGVTLGPKVVLDDGAHIGESVRLEEMLGLSAPVIKESLKRAVVYGPSKLSFS